MKIIIFVIAALILSSTVFAAPAMNKGLEFNPEVFQPSGASYQGAWFNWYHSNAPPGNLTVRQQVNAEMRAIKNTTQVGMITILLTSDFHLTWPVPTNSQLTNLVNLVNDSNSNGLRTALLISTPCVVPNSAFSVNENRKHVGGHNKSEVVNSITLYWNVSYCDNNNIALSKAWYEKILIALDTNTAPGSVAYLAISGIPEAPYATEMNVFRSEYPHLNESKNYISQLVPYLKNVSSIPIGISLLPSLWVTNTTQRYEFLTVLDSAVNISKFDYLDITVDNSIVPQEIINRIGASNSQKVILSDFKLMEMRDTEYNVMNKVFMDVRNNGFGGWWIWQYRDTPVQNYIGIRQSGYSGDTGWKMNLVDLIKSDLALPTLTFSASSLNITQGLATTLTWSSGNTTTCFASGSWSGSKALTGSQVVSPTSTSTYILTCSGNGESITKSVTVTVTLIPFDFSISNGGSKTVSQSSSVTNTITSTLVSGSTQSVSYSASGLPSGASASFSPTSCNPTCTTTMTINAASSTPAGTYTITVTGTSSVTKTTEFSLTINSGGDTIPPIILNKTKSVMLRTASMSVMTNEPSNILINYGVTNSYGLSASNFTFSNNPIVKLYNLTPSTLYNYQVIITDSSGNSASETDTFTTANTYSGIIARGRTTKSGGGPCVSCQVNVTIESFSSSAITLSDGTFSIVLSSAFAPGIYSVDITVKDGSVIKLFKKRTTIF